MGRPWPHRVSTLRHIGHQLKYTWFDVLLSSSSTVKSPISNFGTSSLLSCGIVSTFVFRRDNSSTCLLILPFLYLTGRCNIHRMLRPLWSSIVKTNEGRRYRWARWSVCTLSTITGLSMTIRRRGILARMRNSFLPPTTRDLDQKSICFRSPSRWVGIMRIRRHNHFRRNQWNTEGRPSVYQVQDVNTSCWSRLEGHPFPRLQVGSCQVFPFSTTYSMGVTFRLFRLWISGRHFTDQETILIVFICPRLSLAQWFNIAFLNFKLARLNHVSQTFNLSLEKSQFIILSVTPASAKDFKVSSTCLLFSSKLLEKMKTSYK